MTCLLGCQSFLFDFDLGSFLVFDQKPLWSHLVNSQLLPKLLQELTNQMLTEILKTTQESKEHHEQGPQLRQLQIILKPKNNIDKDCEYSY